MLRSMFSGVSSLKAHQLRLDVIGNNIANVLTVGYKASNTTFSELYSQNLKGASSSTPSRGGTNPMQVGLGANVASILVNHTKGSIQRTEVPTNLMIDGGGFFMVSSDPNGQDKYYTRAGNFELDELGFLVTTEGLKVLDVNFKPVQINMSDTKSASASQHLTINGNINKDQKDYTTTVDLYDSLGSVHTVNIDFKGEPLATTAPKTIDPRDPRFDANVPGATMTYSYRQMIIRDNENNQMLPPVGEDPIFVKFNSHGEVVDLVRLGNPPDPNTAGETRYNANLVMKVPGAADISVAVNRSMFFANADEAGGVRILSQVAKESDAKGVQLYGVSAGRLSSFEISTKGEVTAKYTNGETKVIHTIGLADFDNPTGLMKVGNNLFTVTPNSGVPKFGPPSSSSFGAVQAGALEMSNVDLAQQFTELITTQRGLQANSRVITTSDEILQELVNLKR